MTEHAPADPAPFASDVLGGVPLPAPLERLLHALAWPPELLTRPARLDEAWRRQQRGAAANAPGRGSEPPPFEFFALAEGGLRQLLVLATPAPAVLPRRHDLQLRAIDTAPPLDAAVELARAVAGEGEHALVVDRDTFFLVDLDREEVLLAGDQPHHWEEHLLAAMAGGRATLRRRLAALPRRTAVQSGMELRRFLDRLARVLADAAGQPFEAGWDLALGLLASFHLWRFEPRPPAGAAPTIWDHLAWGGASAPPPPPPRGFDLARLAATFEEAHRRAAPLALWRLGDRDAWLLRWCGLATRDHRPVVERAIGDFLHLARPRLAQPVYEVALLSEEQLYETTRQRLQSRLPSIASLGLVHEGPVVYRPVEIDLRAVGAGWGLDVARALLDYWNAFRRGQLAERRERGGEEAWAPDLFLVATPAAADDGLIEDPVMATLHDSIRFTGTGGMDRRILELLLALVVWEWAWGADADLRPSLASLPKVFG